MIVLSRNLLSTLETITTSSHQPEPLSNLRLLLHSTPCTSSSSVRDVDKLSSPKQLVCVVTIEIEKALERPSRTFVIAGPIEDGEYSNRAPPDTLALLA